MDSLQSIKTQLINQINALQFDQNQKIAVCSAQVKCHMNVLGWLKAQQHYPQFYFKLQDTERTFVGVGAVRTFTQLDAAQAFVNQYQLPLFGGMKFYGETYFFLPQILLELDAQQLTATVFIDQADSANRQLRALEGLKTFEKMTALLDVQAPLTLVNQQADESLWCNWVTRALAEIRQKQVSKLVLANAATFSAPHRLNGKDFLAKSESYHTGCYHFLLAEDEQGCFLGSTPERLYARQARQLNTEALAGTALVSDNPEHNRAQADWLLQDEKNIYENQLVADGICTNLQPFVNKISVGNVGLKPLRQVQHLRREITALLKAECSDKDCLLAIHPTAAVAGLPQQKAKVLLRQIENYDRGWYAGTLGFFNHRQAEFCVTIRSAQLEENKIRIFAGAGIVEGSVPLLEWHEIERKAAGLISLLQITESKNGEKKCQ